MAFKNIKIAGNGDAQTVITNDTTTEAVVNSLVAYNTSDGVLTFSMLIDDVSVVTEEVSANSSFRLVDKLNVQTDTELTINAPTGVDVTVSYFQQAVDSTAALTTVQQAVTDAALSATNASNSESTSITKADEASTSASDALTSENAAEVSEWNAEASKLTSESFAKEDEDTVTKTYASNDDGTYTATDTETYSGLHYSAKSKINADNAAISETNAAASEESVANNALIAQSAANYKGDWDSDYTDGYDLADSVTYTDGHNYVSKVDDNTAEPTSKTSTTEWNFVDTVSPADLADTASSTKNYSIAMAVALG